MHSDFVESNPRYTVCTFMYYRSERKYENDRSMETKLGHIEHIPQGNDATQENATIFTCPGNLAKTSIYEK